MAEYKFIEYKCAVCGDTADRSVIAGRPSPGKCLKKPKKDGTYGPHSWKINRKH